MGDSNSVFKCCHCRMAQSVGAAARSRWVLAVGSGGCRCGRSARAVGTGTGWRGRSAQAVTTARVRLCPSCSFGTMLGAMVRSQKGNKRIKNIWGRTVPACRRHACRPPLIVRHRRACVRPRRSCGHGRGGGALVVRPGRVRCGRARKKLKGVEKKGYQ